MGRIEPAFKPAFLLHVFIQVQFYAPIDRIRETHCNPAYQGGDAARGNASPGVEAVREVQVQTSGMDAESSRNGGGMSQRGVCHFIFPCILKIRKGLERFQVHSEGCISRGIRGLRK